jgi:hypothetical protein
MNDSRLIDTVFIRLKSTTNTNTEANTLGAADPIYNGKMIYLFVRVATTVPITQAQRRDTNTEVIPFLYLYAIDGMSTYADVIKKLAISPTPPVVEFIKDKSSFTRQIAIPSNGPNKSAGRRMKTLPKSSFIYGAAGKIGNEKKLKI